MKRSPLWPSMTIAASLAIVGGIAVAAQDKYTVKVPNGLAFSEFRGYEDWQTVAVSKTDHAFALILANPTMIDAYRAGVPDNGKPFPTAPRWRRSIGSRKRVRRHPIRRRQCRVPCKTLTSWRGIARGSWTAADGDGPRLIMTPRPTPSRPPLKLTSRRRRTTPSADSRAIR